MKKIAAVCLLFSSLATIGQTNVSIDLNCQRFIGDVSELDRSKYFTIHDNGSDPDVQQFLTDYNVSVGRGFWGPFSYAKSKTGAVGTYPAYKTGNTDVRPVQKGYVATEHHKDLIRYNLDMNAAANWSVEYYKNQVTGDRPEYFEPMNEPFVHSGDAVYQEQQPDAQLMRERMADWFGAIGKKFDETPELANMKIVGYASAWPSMELNDFGHWNDRMKMFMDKAGDYMDAFSVHLYDGVNVTGQENQRSGSNAEAILDLLETYSYAKWGVVKEHAITEYGLIESGFPDEYSDLKYIQAIKGQNHLLFGLLDREDKMAISIPFTVGKSTWHINEGNNYNPYGAALWRPLNVVPTSNPNKPAIGGWEYTSRIHFYDLWKDVKGSRVKVETSDPDVFVQAFVEGNMAYVCLNNIENNTKTVNLDFLNSIVGLTNVSIKSLKIFIDKDPEFTSVTQTNAPQNIELIEGQTVVLAYQFDSPVGFNNAIRSKKYYDINHLKSIVSGQLLNFNFNNVGLGVNGGKALLRMSIGRKHDRSKAPLITINGTQITVPSDWKGYDQNNRSDFFGTIEIPFSVDLLQTNNVVSVTFPDNGGRVSSMVLDVRLYDNGVVNSPSETVVLTDDVYSYDEEATLFHFGVEFDANEQREVFVELKAADGTWLGGIKKVVEPGINKRDTLVLDLGQLVVDSNYVVNAHIRPVGTDWTELINAADAKLIITAINYSPIPGLIQAELFDSQGGIKTENTNDVGGGLNIGFVEDADYVSYKVNVVETALYDLEFRVATNSAGGAAYVFLDGAEVSVVNVSGTGGWQSWASVVSQANLEVGKHDLKLVFNGAAEYLFNVNWLDVQKATVTRVEGALNGVVECFPNPTNGLINFSNETQWELYSPYGVLINEGYGVQIDLSTVNTGVYLVLAEGKPFRIVKY